MPLSRFEDLTTPRELKNRTDRAIDLCQTALLERQNWSRHFRSEATGGGAIACGLIACGRTEDMSLATKITLEFSKLEALKGKNQGWRLSESAMPGQPPEVHITCLALRAYRIHDRTADPAYKEALGWLDTEIGFTQLLQNGSHGSPSLEAPWANLKLAYAVEELANFYSFDTNALTRLQTLLTSKITRLLSTATLFSLNELANISRLVDAFAATLPERAFCIPADVGSWRQSALDGILSVVQRHGTRLPPVQELLVDATDAAFEDREHRPDNWAHMLDERALIALLRLGHPVLSDEVRSLLGSILNRQRDGLWWSDLNPGVPSIFACAEAMDALRMFRRALQESVPIVQVNGDVVQEAFIIETRSTWHLMPRIHAWLNQPSQRSWIPRAGGALLTAQYLETHAFVEINARLARWREKALPSWVPPSGLPKGADTFERQIFGVAPDEKGHWRVMSSLLRQRCEWSPDHSEEYLIKDPPRLAVVDDVRPIDSEDEASWRGIAPVVPLIIKTTRPSNLLPLLNQRASLTLIIADLLQVLSAERVPHPHSWDKIVEIIHNWLKMPQADHPRQSAGICLVAGRAGCLYYWTGGVKQSEWRGTLWWDLQGTRGVLERREEGWFAGSHNLFVSEVVRAIFAGDPTVINLSNAEILQDAIGSAWDVVRGTIEAGVDLDGVPPVDDAGSNEPVDLARWAFRPRPPPISAAGKVEITASGDLAPLNAPLIAALNVLTQGTGALQRVTATTQRQNLSPRTLPLRPVLVLGDLVAVAPAAVEELGYLARLIEDYRQRPDPRLLSIAVFGQPGSGKSFAVRQIARATLGDAKFLEFNLAQFEHSDQLLEAFHRIQSASLEDGRFPVVFWDEFDTYNYRWVKDFLAPLQDRLFAVGGIVHHLPQCLFVFAGGVTESAEDFKQVVAAAREAATDEGRMHKAAKLPDFETRLKAYHTVQPIVPTEDDPQPLQDDLAILLVRATLLNSLLRRHAPAARRIHRDLATALLLCDKYTVARSLERLFERSTLANLDVVTWGTLYHEDSAALLATLRDWHRSGWHSQPCLVQQWDKLGEVIPIEK